MDKKHPFNDRFYDEKPFLTAERCLGERVRHTLEYIKENNIDTVVFVFNENLKKSLKKLGKIKKLEGIYFAEDKHYVYAINNILFYVPVMGAPNAACLIEDFVFMGIKKFLACGSAGLIDPNFDKKKMLIVKDAIRDEGTSYHYAPVEVKAETDKEITEAIEKVFKNHNIAYEVGKVWTTDGLFRETPSLINTRIKQGATCVDMECSTWCIVAKYYGVKFGQFLYFSDAVVDGEWDWIGKNDFGDTTDFITRIAYDIAKQL